jgi:hypothetical protein
MATAVGFPLKVNFALEQADHEGPQGEQKYSSTLSLT